MDPDQDAAWDALVASIGALHIESQSATAPPEAAALEHGKSIARHYFREVRPQLRLLAVESRVLGELDHGLEGLFSFPDDHPDPESFAKALDSLADLIAKVSLAREYRLSDESFEQAAPRLSAITDHEERIITTMESLVPSAAKAFLQAILDSADTTRVSYRGPANEFREALREVLDYLAPDADVMAQPGFECEAEEELPTRRQKVRYILKARKLTRPAARIPEYLVEQMDTKAAGIAATTYTLANVAAHIETERIELLRMRRYADLVLSELLEVSE